MSRAYRWNKDPDDDPVEDKYGYLSLRPRQALLKIRADLDRIAERRARLKAEINALDRERVDIARHTVAWALKTTPGGRGWDPETAALWAVIEALDTWAHGSH